MKDIKIIKIYEPTSTDGYTNEGDGIYFLESSLARIAGENKHGNYASEPLEHLAIEVEKGQYLLIKSSERIVLADSEEYKTKIKLAALGKLTKEEKELLGLM